jgi:hypothetical protein
VVIGQPLYPSGNIEHDFSILIDFYRAIEGKNPELGIW